MRFGVPLATAVFLAYAAHDWWLLGAAGPAAWRVRFGLFLPVAVVVIGLLYAPGDRWRRLAQPALLAFGLAACTTVIWIAALVPGTGAYFLYTSYAFLFVVMGPLVLRLEVVTEVLFAALTLAIYLLFDATRVHAEPSIAGSVSVTIAAMGAIGALVSRASERQAWEAYRQRLTIAEQVAALAAGKRRVEELLANVLPPKIAERLERDGLPLADGVAEVSVLFADIVGFTRMSERVPPRELVERLNDVFSSFDDLADKLRLEKIKTIGDAYMVVAGLNVERHDPLEALAEMALALQRRTAEFGERFGEPLALRVGLHVGPAVAGVIGKRKYTYDVWGDTVNTASRMESHGEPGTIHVTDAVKQRLEAKYDFSDRGEIEVKGKGRLRTWYLTGRKGGAPKTRLPWET